MVVLIKACICLHTYVCVSACACAVCVYFLHVFVCYKSIILNCVLSVQGIMHSVDGIQTYLRTYLEVLNISTILCGKTAVLVYVQCVVAAFPQTLGLPYTCHVPLHF